MFLIKFYYSFGQFLIKLLSSILFSKKESYQKIIVFRTGSIGDTICAMPALNCILNNFPEAQIDLLINAGENKVSPATILDLDKFHETIDYSGFSKMGLIQFLKKKDYDLFIELPQYDSPLSTLLRNMLVIKLAGIKSGFGWSFDQHFVFRKKQEREHPFVNERDRLLNILKRNGLDCQIENEYLFKPIASNEEKSPSEIDRSKKPIALVIGSNREKNKWPIEKFVELAAYFTKKGHQILLIGGNKEKSYSTHFNQLDGIVDLIGRLSLIELRGLLKTVSLTISNDTGPMHISYSVGTPTIALFSSRDFPGKWYPPENEKNVVFRSANIPCSICIGKSCEKNICMDKIATQEVIKAANNLLIVPREQ